MIFVDTGAFLARYLTRDQHHAAARAAWDELAAGSSRMHSSNFVLDETFTLLGRWAGHDFAADRAEALLTSTTLLILRPDGDDELDALDLFRKLGDQRVSFTDCISFVLMRRHAIGRAFGFDRHFAHAGFELWPPPQA